MGIFLVLVSLLSVTSSLADDYNNFDSFNPYHDIETFKPDEYHERSLKAGSSDIIYYFYSRNNSDDALQVSTSSIETLANSSFVPGKYSLFIVHGWLNGKELYINTDMRKDILRAVDANVVFVDWSIHAGKNYVTAQGAVGRVGNYMGEFVKALQEKFGVENHKLKFIGHSLGAHIVGIAGKFLQGNVIEITGLDPAGPLFTFANKSYRLDSSDGRYVQVIHTNMGVHGIDFNIGNSDYFPNGGRSQPGCGPDVNGNCAHFRSYEYYSESFNNRAFDAHMCKSYIDYKLGRCIYEPIAHMGSFETDVHAYGTYYLDTNDKPPYAQG